MKRISAYQATDGQIFNDKGDCKGHQKNLDIIAAVTDVCSTIDNDSKYFNEDANHNLLTAESAVMFILENAEAIQNALKGKVKEFVATTAETQTT